MCQPLIVDDDLIPEESAQEPVDGPSTPSSHRDGIEVTSSRSARGRCPGQTWDPDEAQVDAHAYR